jgi:hypothetical protein
MVQIIFVGLKTFQGFVAIQLDIKKVENRIFAIIAYKVLPLQKK